MAKLPIVKSDIITPYNFSSTQMASITTTANNKTQAVRRGGYCYAGTLGIKPNNMLSNADKFWSIVGFLTVTPIFEIPMLNLSLTSNKIKSNHVITVTVAANVGDIVLTVSNSSPSGAYFTPGQYLKFANHNKLYQCLAHSANTLILMQPLQHSVGTSVVIVHNETDYDGNVFDGVLCTVINEDYGNPISRIEDGLMGYIGPLTLKEHL